MLFFFIFKDIFTIYYDVLNVTYFTFTNIVSIIAMYGPIREETCTSSSSFPL